MNEKQQLDAELTEVLKHLPGWQLDPKYGEHWWCSVLRDGTGRGIHVNATQAKGRFYISGFWPTDKENHQHVPDKPEHITIARNRPPEKIAADIQRRFLPWYLAAYAEMMERVEQHNTSRNSQQEIAMELADLLGVTPRLQCSPPQVYANGVTIDVHGRDVSIEIRYKSVKVAKAVLNALIKAGGLTE
jgi:hypothetical protein